MYRLSLLAVFYVQKVGTFCTRAPHLLLIQATDFHSVRLFRFTDIIGYHTEFVAVLLLIPNSILYDDSIAVQWTEWSV